MFKIFLFIFFFLFVPWHSGAAQSLRALHWCDHSDSEAGFLVFRFHNAGSQSNRIWKLYAKVPANTNPAPSDVRWKLDQYDKRDSYKVAAYFTDGSRSEYSNVLNLLTPTQGGCVK